MKKKIFRILIALCLVFLPLLVFSVPAFALDNPDTSPNISHVKANRYLLESGDALIYGDYDIPYATPPDTGADSAYIFTLRDGSTIIGSVTPYAMMDNGYNEGIFAFYFSASDNLTWGTKYTIRIAQNPSQFASPQTWDFVMPSTAYTSASDQDTNQSQLKINIILAAQRLQTVYSSDGYTFLDTSAAGTVLSSPTGETYFRGVIYGIQAMASDLFNVQILDLYTTAREWTTDLADNYSSRLDSGWYAVGANATATQVGITPTAVGGMLFIFPVSIGMVVVSSIKFRRAEPGWLGASLLILVGYLMSWIPAALFASCYQAMGLYLSYVWFFSRG